jgi:hypothetical protein
MLHGSTVRLYLASAALLAVVFLNASRDFARLAPPRSTPRPPCVRPASPPPIRERAALLRFRLPRPAPPAAPRRSPSASSARRASSRGC